MNILLTGASGFLGRNTAHALAEAGHRVRPVSRSDGIDMARLLQPEQWLPLLNGIDAVINCVGIISENRRQSFHALHTAAPIALFQACVIAGVRRVLQVSAIGADETAFSQYHLSKRRADDALRELDLDWFIFRPALIYGRGGTSAEWLLKLARSPCIPVVGDGQQRLQPVHVTDVAAVLLRGLGATTTRQTIDVVGGEIVAMTEWLQAMRRALGLAPARIVSVPLSIALLLAKMGRLISPLLQPDTIRMLQASYLADPAAVTALLGRPPQPLSDADFFTDFTTQVSAR